MPVMNGGLRRSSMPPLGRSRKLSSDHKRCYGAERRRNRINRQIVNRAMPPSAPMSTLPMEPIHVIHSASVAVSREHRRAKTDRLDTEQLKRAFLEWLRGEREHCKMAAIPTLAEEDAKRPHRERETLVGEQ